MTTYWKSQDRKYCEFCKCWFADNKVSISFHENGKKHKENVKKHINQLSKRSAKEFKQKEKIENDIKKMEAAAMTAYLKDIQNNADLTSQSINEMLEVSGNTSKDIIVPSSSSKKDVPVWKEVKNEENDSTYFWNMETNETTWDPPDNYVSLAQQEQKKLNDKEEQKRQKKLKKQKLKDAAMEVKAHMTRESMRELAVDKDKPPPTSNIPLFGPVTASKPYGSWKPVVKEPEQKIDLQLPKSKKEVIPPPVVVEPETVQFKEKRIESLGEGPVEFKKRKLNKRNIRQKLDDD
ncbi:WW domain-binding protein 4 [Melitaea cinxia]|uniref:WW domain-binding protein 4 n=1 Tax=Melitaea cinxia TaxID=113334 RepID=UPI001E2737B2|nr:WW domain-binding protein 4 [Melitaea cinxia]